MFLNMASLPISLHQTLLDKASYVTSFMITILGQNKVTRKLKHFIDLSYPARSLLIRLEDFHTGNNVLFSDIWNIETLKNIVLTDQDVILEEMEFDEEDLRYVELLGMSGDEFLTSYFGHQPTREELLDYIYLMINREFETGEVDRRSTGIFDPHVGQEYPIAMLMNGLFFASGYQRRIGRIGEDGFRSVVGNLGYLSEEDWQILSLLHGLEDANHETITKMVITEQNKNAEELLLKQYPEIVRGFSLTDMLIQEPIGF